MMDKLTTAGVLKESVVINKGICKGNEIANSVLHEHGRFAEGISS